MLAVRDDVDVHVFVFKELPDRFFCNEKRVIIGKAESSAGNNGKGNGAAAVLLCQFQRMTVAIRQQFRLTVISVLPDRPDRVDDVLGGQIIARADHSLSDLQRRKGQQRFIQIGPGCFVDGIVCAPGAGVPGICRVNDCVHEKSGNICMDHKDRHLTRPFISGLFLFYLKNGQFAIPLDALLDKRPRDAAGLI